MFCVISKNDASSINKKKKKKKKIQKKKKKKMTKFDRESCQEVFDEPVSLKKAQQVNT